MRCVFDTNVLVSGLLLPTSKPRQALDLALHRGAVLLSFAVLAELYEVLSRKQFARYVDEEAVRKFVATLTRETEWIEVDIEIVACRDTRDDKFLELAVSGHATHIVTGDSDLLALNSFRGIEILSPNSFLALPPSQDYGLGLVV